MSTENQDILLDENFEVVENPTLPVDENLSGAPEDEQKPVVSAEEPEDDDDSREDLSGTEEEREAIRARRREERKIRKQRQHEREDNLRRELDASKAVINQLNERLDLIDRRNNGFDLAQIDAQLNQLNQLYIGERDRIARGTADNNGEEVAAATERMMQIRERFGQLQSVRQAYQQARTATPPLDPRIRQYGDEWSARNSWYNPNGKDIKSRVTRVIDDSLVQEGWDPTTKQYWDELDKRVKTHFNGSQQTSRQETERQPGGQRRPSGGPPMGGTGTGASNGSAGYVLSAERKKAIEDAGLWADPVKRKAAIENYKKYDAEHKE